MVKWLPCAYIRCRCAANDASMPNMRPYYSEFVEKYIYSMRDTKCCCIECSMVLNGCSCNRCKVICMNVPSHVNAWTRLCRQLSSKSTHRASESTWNVWFGSYFVYSVVASIRFNDVFTYSFGWPYQNLFARMCTAFRLNALDARIRLIIKRYENTL